MLHDALGEGGRQLRWKVRRAPTGLSGTRKVLYAAQRVRAVNQA